ncbi:MAG: protein kinase domain-containing protein [Chthoniobacterales bacterium]
MSSNITNSFTSSSAGSANLGSSVVESDSVIKSTGSRGTKRSFSAIDSSPLSGANNSGAAITSRLENATVTSSTSSAISKKTQRTTASDEQVSLFVTAILPGDQDRTLGLAQRFKNILLGMEPQSSEALARVFQEDLGLTQESNSSTNNLTSQLSFRLQLATEVRTNSQGEIAQTLIKGSQDISNTPDSYWAKCLKAFGIQVISPLGSGSFGSVSRIAIEGSDREYVLKTENNIRGRFFAAEKDPNNNLFHERGELVLTSFQGEKSARLEKELQRMTPPCFVIVAWCEDSHSTMVHYEYLSPARAKEFGNRILETHPHAVGSIAAQVMELAPGIDLEKAMEGGMTFKPTEKTFKNVLNTLYNHIKFSHDYKIAHRDIKPANLVIEPNSSEVRVIDFGLSASTNGKKLQSRTGTPKYASPRILLQQELRFPGYGEEVDCYSAAMTLLELIDPASCEGVMKFLGQNAPFYQHYLHWPAASRLNNYFLLVEHVNPNAEILKIFAGDNINTVKEYGDADTFISLSFLIAEGGAQGEEAYRQLIAQFDPWQEANGFEVLS